MAGEELHNPKLLFPEQQHSNISARVKKMFPSQIPDNKWRRYAAEVARSGNWIELRMYDGGQHGAERHVAVVAHAMADAAHIYG